MVSEHGVWCEQNDGQGMPSVIQRKASCSDFQGGCCFSLETRADSALRCFISKPESFQNGTSAAATLPLPLN